MNYDYVHLWGIPLYISNISSVSENVLQYVKDDTNYVPMNNEIANANITKDKNILNMEMFSSLKEEVMSHVNNYIFEHLKISKEKHGDGFYIHNSWVNEIKDKQGAPTHIHVNSLFSGTIYIDIPEDSTGGELQFTKPNIIPTIYSPTITFDHDQWNSLTCKYWAIPAVTNRIVLFPSHQQHQVSLYKGKDPRYSLAFNVFYKGNVGKDESELNL